MNRELSELLEKALSLPPELRAALAGSLLESLENHVDASAEEERNLPRVPKWSEYLAEGPVASPTFMDNVEDLPTGGRKLRR